ncbi:MAG: beta-lactamase family protein [Clostridiales bacterium]|nr:beta-lactamase family protein [Clostridiales bacterium]
MKGASESAPLESKLGRLAARYDARSDTNDVRFALSSPSHNFDWQWESTGSPEQYFIASTTKLYVTALVMQLRNESSVDLDVPVVTYVGDSLMSGIHVLNGVDSSGVITLRQLLSHTSGIADYFEQRRGDGSSQITHALREDFSWTLDDVLRITRSELIPRFAPGTPGKAFYSDTNFQILGAVIEAVTGCSYEEALFERILSPLGLSDTYPFTRETIDRYDSVAAMLHGACLVRIPKAMASVRADGGMVSTAGDGLVFLRAFMRGHLFPVEYLDEMQQRWTPIFPPLEYGVGLMRFALPRYYTIFRKVPFMVGHSGASGAVLFYVPKLDLYVSGTINQIKKRSLSYNLMVRMVLSCEDAWQA